ncbi:hypothetical protein BGY98DRAFT_1104398 [Russula aff. rugulosa BPL654]|nr:hypothetical protein BGY98DRAFT_1104398 [Russula aff. rugulosa BPL654]
MPKLSPLPSAPSNDSSPCAQSPSLTSRPPSKQSTTAFRKLSTDSSRSSRLSSSSSPTSQPSTTDYSQMSLHESRTAVLPSTQAATPRRIAMLIVNKVTFALEMIESVLTNYHQPTLPQVCLSLYSYYNTTLLLLLERLSDRSTFPLALRGMHIVFHLLE